jgi:Ulp1 family protease
MAEESTDYKQYKHFERVKCPQQSNGFDCGVYVCKNA